jgi:aspartate racemase
MKTIGLIGGMSAESSIEYYRIINETLREKLGGLHSAKSVMVSVDFAEIEALQSSGKWNEATEIMVTTARQVEKGGADFMLICTNTMHKMAPQVQENINIPLLHIADATADTIIDQGYQKIGLLGTRFTMEQDFYKDRLINKHGLDVLIPGKNERKTIDDVIYNELVQGKILPASKKKYIKIMGDLVDAGAQGIILGCTEIGLLVSGKDCQVPLFNTTQIHARAAVKYALGE